MGKIYGYCRISRNTQRVERQIRNIREEYPDAIIIQEAFTGTRIDRPKWSALYRNLKSGDKVIFDSVSRMSRDAKEGFAVYTDLFNRGVDLIFLKEHYIDTTTYKAASEGQIKVQISTGDDATDDLVSGITEVINRYLTKLTEQQIYAAFGQAEKEVNDLHQRTKEGIETARLTGKQIGGVRGKKLVTRKSISAKEVIKKHSKSFGGSLEDEDVMKLAGISHNTYYKYKKELHSESI